jgi:Spy/CpxP family protein refolding chaperone
MRNKFLALTMGTVLGIGMTIVPLAAQDTTQGNKTHQRRQPDPKRQVERLSKRLNLTDDQKAQLLPILTNRQQQMQSIRQDTSLSRQDRMEKMRTLMQDSNTKITALLNDDQKQKYADMQQHRRGRWQHRGNNGASEGAAPQNQ